MADYWKSQPRKFCELCKCWMADNKASRDFHERGKRHQESVKRKLDDMRKKGIEDAKKDREVKSYLAEMERGAMKKFKQDLVQDPMLAAMYGIAPSSIYVPSGPSYSFKEDSSAYQNQQKKPGDKNSAVPKKKKGEAIYPQPNPNAPPPEESTVPVVHGDWQEVMTDDGHLYYWNNKTGESSWCLPGTPEYDDYIKQIANMPAGQAAAYFQNRQQGYTADPIYPVLDGDNIPLPLSSTDGENSLKVEVTLDPVPESSSLEANVVKMEAEDVKVKTETSEQTEVAPKLEEDDSGEIYAGIQWKKRKRDSAYGEWEEVKPKSTLTSVDLQLPETKKMKISTIVIPKEVKPVIKEKTMPVSYGNKPLVEFKKRSQNDDKCQKRSKNIRQRRGDDDI